MVFLLPVFTDLVICSYTYLNTALKIWISSSQSFKTQTMYISSCYFKFSSLDVEQTSQSWTPNWTSDLFTKICFIVFPLFSYDILILLVTQVKNREPIFESFRKLLALPWKYNKNPITFFYFYCYHSVHVTVFSV